MHPSGRFVYGSNRGHDSIAVYRIHQDSGRLDQVEVEPIGGRTPRNFAIDPSGQFLLAEGQDSDSITVFRIHPESGALEPTGTKLQVPSPVCIRFLNPPQPAGR
jgi:6-phosphogluconolactonase